jgi:hypothetical protein
MAPLQEYLMGALASGGGTNLQAIYVVSHRTALSYEVILY